MAYQKGKMIDDSVRANVYGLMRIPLNVFVVLVLSTTKDGGYSRNRKCTFTDRDRVPPSGFGLHDLQCFASACCCGEWMTRGLISVHNF